MNHVTRFSPKRGLSQIAALTLFLIIPLQAECHNLTPIQMVNRLYGIKDSSVIASLRPDDFNPWLGRIAWSDEGYKATDLRQYYIPEIAEYLISHEKDRPNLCLDFGVLIDGNDHLIENFQIITKNQTKNSTKFVVSFTNFKRPTRIVITFLRTNQGWQIEDVQLTDFSLREHIKACIAQGI